MEALHAKELPNFHETLSCLQEQLTAKAVKMASRLYLIPGEVLFDQATREQSCLDLAFEVTCVFVDFVVVFFFEKVIR